MNLEGCAVVVTGASSGIGAAVAIDIGRRGAIVGLLARRLDRLEAVAHQIDDAGGTAHILHVDVRDSAALTRALDDFAKLCGRLDGLVNNAGHG